MKTVYTNISPITNAYTNFNHIFYLKNKLKAKKVYLCIWDSFVLEDPRFYRKIDARKNKLHKLEENIRILEKLLKYCKIDYKIIYFSEAWDRLFKKTAFSMLFKKIVSKINFKDMIKGFDLTYIPFEDISVSKINYIIADYLIALHLNELFPELCENIPEIYLTSTRFKIFNNIIYSVLSENYGYLKFPELVLTENIPVIIHSKTGIIPSLEMNYDSIHKIVKNHFENRNDQKEILDFLKVLNCVIDNFEYKNKKVKLNSLFNILKNDKSLVIENLSLNLKNYFDKIKEILKTSKVEEKKKSLFITEEHEFERIRNLNPLKLRILKYCNGNNSSLDIARKTGLNFGTISSYFTQLKKQGLISNSKKPERKFQNIVLDFDSINFRSLK